MASVFVATPMYGGMCYGGYLISILDTLDKLKDKNITMYFGELTNESLITRARNSLVRRFLDTDAEYLIFIDSDIVFSGDDVLKLLSHEKDIVCGLYPKKTVDWGAVRWAVNNNVENLQDYAAEYVLNATETPSAVASNGVVEIMHAGTGFMCIHRRVFEQLADKVPSYRESTVTVNGERQKNPDGTDKFPLTKEFFSLKIRESDGLYLSEDYAFCHLWRNHGGKIYADLTIKLRHMGTYVFSGDLQRFLTRGMQK